MYGYSTYGSITYSGRLDIVVVTDIIGDYYPHDENRYTKRDDYYPHDEDRYTKRDDYYPHDEDRYTAITT